MNADIAKRIMIARTALVLDQPFFGALALRLALREDTTCETAWVDGVTLGYNPKFIDTLTHEQLTGLLAHEVMHCAAGHPWRRDAREVKPWNDAADRAINPMLRDVGFELPDGALDALDPSHVGKSVEWIYDRLPSPQDKDDGQDEGDQEPQSQPRGGEGEDVGKGEDEGGGNGNEQEESQGSPNPQGEVRDAPAETDTTEEDWRQATQQAAIMARAQGNLPSSMDRFAQQAATTRVDWRSALRRFVQEVARADYAWSRPNPRHLVRGFYLPGLRSEEMGALAVGVDTSGSIDQVLLNQFATELQAIADEVQPRRITVFYCDAVVQRREVFEPGDPITLKVCGGGGTDFRPVFTALAQEDEPHVALVYLTDLYGTFPPAAPEYPVLWASISAKIEVPFGEVVTV